jgi:hypothetical protein
MIENADLSRFLHEIIDVETRRLTELGINRFTVSRASKGSTLYRVE